MLGSGRKCTYMLVVQGRDITFEEHCTILSILILETSERIFWPAVYRQLLHNLVKYSPWARRSNYYYHTTKTSVATSFSFPGCDASPYWRLVVCTRRWEARCCSEKSDTRLIVEGICMYLPLMVSSFFSYCVLFSMPQRWWYVRGEWNKSYERDVDVT